MTKPDASSPIQCKACGAATGLRGTGEMLQCQFCGATAPRPILEAALIAEVDRPEPVEPEWVQRRRDEIKTLEHQQTLKIAKLLGCVFLVLLPGIGIGVGGAVSMGLQERVLPAITSGVIGFLIAVTGVILIVMCGIAVSRGHNVIREKRFQIRSY